MPTSHKLLCSFSSFWRFFTRIGALWGPDYETHESAVTFFGDYLGDYGGRSGVGSSGPGGASEPPRALSADAAAAAAPAVDGRQMAWRELPKGEAGGEAGGTEGRGLRGV